MKKIVITLFLLMSAITSAQNFFPTKPGDVYQLREHTQYWFEPYNWVEFRQSLATEILFNNKSYVWAWDHFYHMDTTVNKLFILLNNEEKLAFDFNKPDGDTDTLYFDGYARLYTYSSIQNWIIFDETRIVRKIENNSYDGPQSYYLAEDIGIYKYEKINTVGRFDYNETVVSAIIDDSVYNPISLDVTAYFPNKIARNQSSFSFWVNIDTEYIELVDSLKAHLVAYKSDSLIYQNTFIGSVELQKIVISIPSQILSQIDSIGIKVRCTDESIFNNEAFFPQSGYKFIPVEDDVEWTLFTPTLPGMNYMGMKFFSANKGYIYKNNGDLLNLIVYSHSTTNGGASFPTFSNPNWNYLTINDIISFNGNTGYIINDVLRKSVNQGLTWVTVLSGAVEAMSFIDQQKGWVIKTYERKIFRTYDGGANWESFNNNLAERFKLIDFVQVNEGYAVTLSGKVYRSSDSGESWQFTNSTLANQKKLEMFQDGKGWLIGNGIWRTEDAGGSWNQQFEGNFVDAHFFSKDKGWVIGKVNDTNVLLRTIDGGNNWSDMEIPYTQGDLKNIDFVDEVHGWIYAHSIYSDELLRTTNGGVTFVEDERFQNVQATDFSLQQNYPNPFNPSTIISYELPAAGDVSLKVYDVLGREVVTLVNEYKNAGSYEVEFKSTVGSRQLANGVYFYRLQAGDYSQTKKMILLK